MMTLAHILEDRAKQAIQSAFGASYTGSVEVVQSTSAQFGHYQCNSAMRLAKELKQNPRQVASAIVEHLEKGDLLSEVAIAGPGFINLTLDPHFLSAEIDKMQRDAHLCITPAGKKERIIVEFSSPNVAKELHVGHLRSTVIGDSLARLFEYLGHDVLRLNHIGDWGTQFGMLIAFLKEEHPALFSGAEEADLPTLMHWYKESKKKFDQDPEFKKRSQLQVVALQGGDREALAAWEKICDISRRSYQEIYRLLNVKITERGESFYNPMLAQTVADLDQKGLITMSDGAKCVFLDEFKGREGEPLPMIIQKSDGGFNYDTTDMAAMIHRIQKEKAKRIIIVTDGGQSLHFAMLRAVSKKAGYLDETKVRFDHVPFGVVLGPDGKKFKTREGETEKLIDLLNGAITRAEQIIQERSPEMPPEEQKHLAKVIGIGAVKYADLSGVRTKDYQFSYERMLRFEGNTAAFLLYSYVRIHGIKRKVGKEIDSSAKARLSHPSEIALALHLCQFQEALDLMAEELLPNRLTEYLYALAEKFNAFFRDCRVEGSEEEQSRLILCSVAERVLAAGLHLLGLETVERM